MRIPTEPKKSTGGKSRVKRCLFTFLTISILAGAVCASCFLWIGQGGNHVTRESIQDLKENAIIKSFARWRQFQVQQSEGKILEVATATGVEVFSHGYIVKMWGLPVLSKVSNISVPATYRFYIDLGADWRVEVDGPRLIVTAPAPQASLPVAFDTTEMTKTESGWGKYIPVNNMAELQKTITSRLGDRAVDPKTLLSVRDESRQSIAKFLRTWLLTEKEWSEGHFEELVVLFQGEDPIKQYPAVKVRNQQERRTAEPTWSGKLGSGITASITPLIHQADDSFKVIQAKIYKRLRATRDAGPRSLYEKMLGGLRENRGFPRSSTAIASPAADTAPPVSEAELWRSTSESG